MQLSDLRQGIQDRGYGEDTTAAQNRFINATYRDIISERRWWWLEHSGTVALANGSAVADTSSLSSFLSFNAVRLPASAIGPELEYLPPQELRSREQITDVVAGSPTYWSWVNQQLRFYPPADQDYTVTVDYVATPADLVNDVDVPAFPAAYHNLLVWGPLKSIAMRERDFWSYQMYSGEYEASLGRMRAEQQSVRQTQSGRHVRRSGYWD